MRIGNWNIGAPTTLPALGAALQRAMEPIIRQLNAASEGQIAGATNANTAPPAAGGAAAYAQGDFIRNSAPAELGTTGAKYVVLGWICVSAGAPGTWRACRCLTGN
jgi:hypothetical protein